MNGHHARMKAPDPRIDPEVLCFVERLAADYSAHPPMDAASVQEKRRIASAVRAPWAEGGPVMVRTTELEVPLSTGAVRVRLHYPTLGNDLPALVYAHGGGWVFFDLDTHDRLMREYAARAGIVVVGIDYTRAPEARYPVALDELVGLTEKITEEKVALWTVVAEFNRLAE